MAIGLGILLIVIGAIVAFVLQVDIPGLGDVGFGVILMTAGAAAIVLSFAKAHQRGSQHTTVHRDQDATGSFVEERTTA